jgi:hypothetical protein
MNYSATKEGSFDFEISSVIEDVRVMVSHPEGVL